MRVIQSYLFLMIYAFLLLMKLLLLLVLFSLMSWSSPTFKCSISGNVSSHFVDALLLIFSVILSVILFFPPEDKFVNYSAQFSPLFSPVKYFSTTIVFRLIKFIHILCQESTCRMQMKTSVSNSGILNENDGCCMSVMLLLETSL